MGYGVLAWLLSPQLPRKTCEKKMTADRTIAAQHYLIRQRQSVAEIPK